MLAIDESGEKSSAALDLCQRAAIVALQHNAARGIVMISPWYSTMMLAAESCNVIGLRMIKLAVGGQGALDEAQLMVNEKVAASWEATTAMLTGGNALGVVDRYREHVAANADRLTAGC